MKAKGIVSLYRVSTKKQLAGESIERQKDEVRDYCRGKGRAILHEFELAETASRKESRLEFQKALDYCEAHKHQISHVVIWGVDRFCRGGLGEYYRLKSYLAALGIGLLSATEDIEDEESGELNEAIYAIVARQENKNRVKRCIGMEVRLTGEGYWCRPAPTGFENTKAVAGVDEHGKQRKRPVLQPTRDQYQWDLLCQGLRKQMTGLYTITEIAAELREKGFVTRNGTPLSPQTWTKICRMPVYGGLLCEKWTGYEHIRAKFDGAITPEEWWKLQKTLNGDRTETVKIPRKKLRSEFPLRQFLCCPTCGKRVSGSPSTGKMKKQYFYYVCPKRACKFSVRAETANDLFVEQLKKMKPAPEALALFKEIVLDRWKDRYKSLRDETTETTKEVLGLRERKANLFKLIEQSADCPELVDDLKQQYREVNKQLTLATTERQEREIDEYDAETVMNHCIYFVENAYKLWENASVEAKFRFQSLLFPEGIGYGALQGLQTPKTSLVYEAIAAMQGDDKPLAAPRRIELRLTD